MLVATAGHVDHGKTSLVRALTGVDTDRLAEEKARGLTIDLGFAYQPVATAAGTVQLGFIDVPGHERFIHNMLAGVAGIDHALLVVAADDGVMPQTREHLEVLALLGIPAVTLVVNKCDRASPERAAEVAAAGQALLAGAGIRCLASHQTSASTGTGLPALQEHLHQLAGQWSANSDQGAFRLSIDRAFTLTGTGVVATGTVHSGQVHSGATLHHHPSGISVRVRGLRVHNQAAELAGRGRRVALNLTGIRHTELSRGHWLLDTANTGSSQRLHVQTGMLAGGRPLRPQTPVTVHLAASRVHGRLSALTSARLEPGTTAMAELVLEQPLPARWQDRLVLRDDGGQHNLAGARVLDSRPPARGRRGTPHLAWLDTLARLDSPDLPSLLAAAPDGLAMELLTDTFNLPPALAAALAAAAATISQGPTTLLLATGRWQEIQNQVLGAVQAWQRQSPQTAGINDSQLLALCRAAAPQHLLRAAATNLVQAGRLQRSGKLLHSPDHQAKLHGADAKRWQRLHSHLQTAGMPPPVVHDLAGQLGDAPKDLQQFLERMRHLGLLVRVADNRYFLPAQVRTLAEQAAALGASKDDGEFSAREFRDAAGIGRNLAIEALEYFDVVGLTRRLGDRRRVVQPVNAVC